MRRIARLRRRAIETLAYACSGRVDGYFRFDGGSATTRSDAHRMLLISASRGESHKADVGE